jgi:hypothetical protein
MEEQLPIPVPQNLPSLTLNLEIYIQEHLLPKS